jgi:hypothetical protein
VFVARYIPKKVSSISPKDSKVVLAGSVAQKKEKSFILDDGTGKIEVFFEGNLNASLVRAFCSVSEEKINADIVQNLDGLDLNLFKRVEDLYNRYYV